MGLTNLTNLFSRDFVVGYMMPSVLLVFGILAVLGIFEIIPVSYDWLADDSLMGLAITTVIVWLIGVVLSLLNHHIVRLFEGYWLFNWLWLPQEIQVSKFKRLVRHKKGIVQTWKQHEDKDEEIPEELKKQWMQTNERMAKFYPEEEKDLLPTKLGNAIRAFERYPNLMYGLEGIDGWLRLLGVIDADYRKLLSSAKAAVDFWINTCLVFLVFVVLFFGAAIYTGEEHYVFGEAYWHGGIADPWLLVMPLASLILAAGSYLAAVSAAVAWGGFVKSAFDLYVNDLAVKLGFELPRDLYGRSKVWSQFSKAIVYRNPKNLAWAQGAGIMRS